MRKTETMHVLCLAWHRICTQLLIVISYYHFYLLSLINSRVMYTCSLNFLTFYLVLNPPNSLPFFISLISCGTFDFCFHLKPSPWLVKWHIFAAHLFLTLLTFLWYTASAHYLNSVLSLPCILYVDVFLWTFQLLS